MDENACDLVVMIVELSLLLQDIVGRNLNIGIELPNDYFPHFRTRDNCANVILDTGRWSILLIFRDDLVGVVDCWGNDCTGGLMALDLRSDQRVAGSLLVWLDAASAKLVWDDVSSLGSVLS